MRLQMWSGSLVTGTRGPPFHGEGVRQNNGAGAAVAAGKGDYIGLSVGGWADPPGQVANRGEFRPAGGRGRLHRPVQAMWTAVCADPAR
jgi:hypothetical protein